MSGRAELLILVGGSEPSAPLHAVLTDAAGVMVERQVVGAERGAVAPAMAGPRTILVLPGAEAQLKRLILPARTEVQARAAAPLMFEGALAASEDVHYAIGAAQNAEGARLVAAIARPRIEAWLERCRAVGADPHRVYLDFSVWPAPPGAVEIVETEAATWVAGGELGGFAIEPSIAPPLLARWLARNAAAAPQLSLVNGDAEAWRARLGPGAPAPQARACEDLSAELMRGVADAPAFAPNLRQGDLAPARAGAEPLRLWRFAAVLALLAAMLQAASLGVAGWRDQQAAREIMQDAERDFRAARPDVRRIVNLRAQVAAMANAMEQSGAHPVLAASEPLIRALQTNAVVRLDGLRHEGPERRVRLNLSAPQPQPLEAVAENLRSQGLEVETRATLPIEGRYTIELVVESP